MLEIKNDETLDNLNYNLTMSRNIQAAFEHFHDGHGEWIEPRKCLKWYVFVSTTLKYYFWYGYQSNILKSCVKAFSLFYENASKSLAIISNSLITMEAN